MRDRVKRAFAKAKSASPPRKEALFRKWRSLRNEYGEKTRSARDFSWQKYYGRIKAGKKASRLSKILASNPEAWIEALKFPNGKYTTNERDSHF